MALDTADRAAKPSTAMGSPTGPALAT